MISYSYNDKLGLLGQVSIHSASAPDLPFSPPHSVTLGRGSVTISSASWQDVQLSQRWTVILQGKRHVPPKQLWLAQPWENGTLLLQVSWDHHMPSRNSGKRQNSSGPIPWRTWGLAPSAPRQQQAGVSVVATHSLKWSHLGGGPLQSLVLSLSISPHPELGSS